MGRGRDTCICCSGPSALRNPRPIEGTCEHCKGRVCKKHLRWRDGWLCSRCHRRGVAAERAAHTAQED